MELVQLKLEKDTKITKYISLIRKFDSSISIRQIKESIENDSYAISFDLQYYDVVEDLQGIDRKVLFRNLISQLEAEGARLRIYVDNELWTLEHLDNCLNTMDEIRRYTEMEMDLEAEQD